MIQELGGGGIDTIQAKISIDLANYKSFGLDVIEHVHLTGATALNATGNTLANDLIGNTGVNKLIGNGGDDTLDGGAGGDSMAGGAGYDTYLVDNMADKVDETGGTGTDTVLSSITFNLTANGATVKGDFENLTLTGTGAITGTGNAFNNVIHGNDAVSKLDRQRATHTITGHGGNDTDRRRERQRHRALHLRPRRPDVISNFDGDAAGAAGYRRPRRPVRQPGCRCARPRRTRHSGRRRHRRRQSIDVNATTVSSTSSPRQPGQSARRHHGRPGRPSVGT